jgi:hypothetical protein
MRHRVAATPIMVAASQDCNRVLKLIPHQELDLIRRGIGNRESIDVLASRISWASVLADQVEFSEDPAPVICAGLDALRSVKARSVDTGRFGATGDELKALGAALTLTDDMHDATTRRQHRDALRVMLKECMP